MSEKSIRKDRGKKEMSERAKKIRKTLMDLSPDVGISKNDFFNLGYGSFTSAAFNVVFIVVFIYYSVTNTMQNKTTRFLVPVGTSVDGVYCEQVPVPITTDYSIDSNGLWSSDTKYNPGDSLYYLEFINAQYSDKKHYRKQMKRFVKNLHDTSHLDYAMNIVFGGSYADVEKAQNGGIINFSLDTDSRLMYNVPIAASGFANANGFCKPDPNLVSFYYDGTNFNLEAAFVSGEYLCPYLWTDYNLESALGATGQESEEATNSSTYSTAIQIDAAAITTAIAVNNGFLDMKRLQVVPSLNTTNLKAYIDPTYMPMTPVYCFDKNQHSFGSQYASFCLIKIGNTFAFPTTNHYGYNTVEKFTPESCDCDNPYGLEQFVCHIYDIAVGLIFVPHDYAHDATSRSKSMSFNAMRSKLFTTLADEASYSSNVVSSIDDYFVDDDKTNDDHQAYPFADQMYHTDEIIQWVLDKQDQVGWKNISKILRPAVSSTIRSAYYMNAGEELSDYDALDSLHDEFNAICDDCVMLAFELFDYSHIDTGPTVNQGSRAIKDMTCKNVWHDADVLNTIQTSYPADIIEPYKVCWDKLGTAVNDGISNAYASAGLYTSVLLFALLWFIGKIEKEPMNSAEEEEVILRNSIADLFEFVIQKVDLSEDDKEFVADKLDLIGITDPMTHAERTQNFSKIAAALIAIPQSESSDVRPSELAVESGAAVVEGEQPAATEMVNV